jgi:hypothetical protein
MAGELPGLRAGKLRPMLLADFLGWNGDEWADTFGIVGVFFIAFPLLVHGLVGYIAAQIIGERQQNQSLARGEDAGSS